ncbi:MULTISPECIES: VOC family protein [unclassified Pseudodesulfovibrio]|uniref:VOC family protein n=1 Tax=unclassified Pseudodesulfovibrio TaxID=2661612 RepID=UPI000FEB7D7D|nr:MULTISPECIES: VOC family protein [unclassified Pseudodesulfovibrio]MCJ2166228.1 VOC family protein [Pseudodesulfovibrio sp. S3-i]RWU02316.1 glyoxalase [Pseudodesulfovibrio sp. S3]
MKPNNISPCIIVKDLDPARSFYPTHLDGRLFFDCGWYINFELGKGGPTLQFMQPQSPEHAEYQGGLIYNLRLETPTLVNETFERLNAAGLPIIMPLEDHPWGDRGFCTLDPYGVSLYVYADIEPSEEFRQYYL